ncbi:hypothetical protein [Collimonas pratensis]|nr:hypothetical protein [Collimonas pratensis]
MLARKEYYRIRLELISFVKDRTKPWTDGSLASRMVALTITLINDMEMISRDKVLDECIDKILKLASLTLYGMNAVGQVHVVINEVCRYLILKKAGDPECNLLAFKKRLMTLSRLTHPSLPDYRKTIDYAASLIVIEAP